jgi:hypothetical protein
MCYFFPGISKEQKRITKANILLFLEFFLLTVNIGSDLRTFHDILEIQTKQNKYEGTKSNREAFYLKFIRIINVYSNYKRKHQKCSLIYKGKE